MKYPLLLTSLVALVLNLAASPSNSIFSITDHGAKSDTGIDNTQAIQATIDACAAQGGGTVVFPAGEWHTGTVCLKSHVTIYLANGAVWRGIENIEAFPFIEASILSRENKQPRRAMIYGIDVEGIKIHGEGTIAPGGEYDIWASSRENKRYYERPYGVYIINGRDITVSGITMKNSAFWMQRYFECDRVKLTGLTIYNHCNLNNDGIDIDGCHDVLIDNCIIDSSDDALVIKSEGLRTCEDIVISNCILASHATPLKCGTAGVGGFRRITMNNIAIRPSKSKHMHHVLNAWGGLSGIDLLNVDGGIMEDIIINNVTMTGVETPIFIKHGNRHSGWEGKPETTPGITRNIQITNLIARECGPISSAIVGYEGFPVQDVNLSNIEIIMRDPESDDIPDTHVPYNTAGYPFNRMYNSNLPSYGFFLRHCKNITFSNVAFRYESGEKRPALHLEQVDSILLDRVRMQPPESGPTMRLREAASVQLLYSPVTTGSIDANETSDFQSIPGQS